MENPGICGKSQICFTWRHWDSWKTPGFLENPEFTGDTGISRKLRDSWKIPNLFRPIIQGRDSQKFWDARWGCPAHIRHRFSRVLPRNPQAPGCGNWRDAGIGGIWEFQPGRGSRIPSFLALPAPGRPPRAVRSPPMPGPFPMPAPPEAPDAPKASVSAGTEPPPPPEPPGE